MQNAFQYLAQRGVVVEIKIARTPKTKANYRSVLTLSRGPDKVTDVWHYQQDGPGPDSLIKLLRELVYSCNSVLNQPFEQWEHDLPQREARKVYGQLKKRAKLLCHMLGSNLDEITALVDESNR